MNTCCIGIDCKPATDQTYDSAKPRSLLKMATSWIADYKLRTADRAALKDLSALNDDLLKDLGLTRADVHRAKQTPWERNPVGELANIARRRGNW